MDGIDIRRNQRPVWAALSALLLTGMIASLLLASHAKASAEGRAAAEAQVAVQRELAPLLTPSDLARPVTGSRYQTLSASVSKRLLSAGESDGVIVFNPEADVVFALERGLVGEHQPGERERIDRVMEQGRESVVDASTFRTYVPLRLAVDAPVVGVAELTRPYEPLWSSASKPWRFTAIGFAALLLPCIGMLILTFRGYRTPFRRPAAPRKAAPADDWGASTEAEPRSAAGRSGALAPVDPKRSPAATPSEGPAYLLPEFKVVVEGKREAEERAAKAEEIAAGLQRQLAAVKEGGQAQSGGAPTRGAGASEPERLKQLLEDAGERIQQGEAQRAQLAEQLRRAEASRAELAEKLNAGGIDSTPTADPGSEQRIRDAEQRAQAAELRATSAEDRITEDQEHLRAAEEQTALAQERAESMDREAARATARAAEIEQDAASAKEQLASAEARAASAEQHAQAAEQRVTSLEADAQAAWDRAQTTEGEVAGTAERIAAAEAEAARAAGRLAEMETALALANERAAAMEADAMEIAAKVTQVEAERTAAAERTGFADAETSHIREQLAAAQEELGQLQQRAELATKRADESEALLQQAAEGRKAESAAAARNAEEQPQLEEVLRVTRERLQHSTERLLETEERARAADHELTEGRERIEELEGQQRREKLTEALKHLNEGNEAAANAAAEQVFEDRRAAGPFLKALSLDAKNSVAAIHGLILTMKHMEEADRPTMLRKLAAHARKLDHLVADLMDADKLARGEVELTYRRTDVNALVRRVVDESAIDDEYTIKVISEKLVVAVDPVRVEEIVSALINNSANRSRPRHDIAVRVEAKDDGVLISVEDEEPSSDASMSPVVSRFADVHGGWAIVEGRQGGGSAFRVFLPDRNESAQTGTTVAPDADRIEIREPSAEPAAPQA